MADDDIVRREEAAVASLIHLSGCNSMGKCCVICCSPSRVDTHN
jgi:hypothetical protein